MSYVALYRTYRPQSFSEVVGQEHIVRTLKNAIKYNKVAHAYLFSGPRGTGKTTIAKIFAKAVNCDHTDLFDSCNECPNCVEINKGSSDCCIEMDAASNNGVDDVREIKDKVKYLPTNGKYKVYIIDEVHMLSNSAFNALLKTLEEPPKHIIFILATTEPHKVPATILSRCQRFDFRAVSQSDIDKRIKIIAEKEHISITEDAIKLIARSAEGGMRDALSLLDQAISYGGEEITPDDVHMVNGSVSNEAIMEIAKATIDCDNLASIKVIEGLLESGKEIPRIINDLMVFYRDVLLYKNVKGYKADEPLYSNQDFMELAKKISNKRLYFYLDILNDTLNSIKISNQKRAFLEMALIKMGDATELQQVLEYEKIKELEERIKNLEENREPVRPKVEKKEETISLGKKIENILNNGNKEKKEFILRGWEKLASINDPEKQAIATLLSKGSLKAMSESEMLLVYDYKGFAATMNKPANKEIVKSILNAKTNLISDYVAIDKETWDYVFGEFRKQYSSGIKKPVLGNINISIQEIKTVSVEKEKSIVDEAVDIFGSENVEIKES